MPLKNLVVGDYTPILKYNAKSGRFSVRQGEQDVEIDRLRFAVDFGSIRLGWVRFHDDAPPDKIFDPDLEVMAPKPDGEGWKRGFEAYVFGPDNVPGVGILGLREWTSTAGSTIAAIHKMYAGYEQGLPGNPGKVPFFGLAQVTPIKGFYGTNYEPVFNLIGWIDRAKIPVLDQQRARQLTATTARGLLAPKVEPPFAETFGTEDEATQPDVDSRIPF